MRISHVLVLVSSVACTDADGTTPPIGPFDPVVEGADVSLLYPLSGTTDRDALIAPSEAGLHGTLLPTLGLPRVFPLDGGDDASDLRAIAIRLDPCSARGDCSPEIRIVFQPVTTTSEGTTAGDGALHAFYALPADELQQFLTEILALKKAHGDGVTYPDALGPHPILVATGLEGDFAEGVRAALLTHVGVDRLLRVTAMEHNGTEGDQWTFRVFERAGATFAEGSIANTTTSQQVIGGTSAIDGTLGGTFDGGLTITPTLLDVAELANASRPVQPTAAIRSGFAQALEAQHPARHTSEDTDCGTCHLAEGARRAGIDVYGFTPTNDLPSAPYLRDTAAVTNLHAFGYLGTSISIMQRTANETSIVADQMQTALLGPAH